jgi:hypothetical protein
MVSGEVWSGCGVENGQRFGEGEEGRCSREERNDSETREEVEKDGLETFALEDRVEDFGDGVWTGMRNTESLRLE